MTDHEMAGNSGETKTSLHRNFGLIGDVVVSEWVREQNEGLTGGSLEPYTDDPALDQTPQVKEPQPEIRSDVLSRQQKN